MTSDQPENPENRVSRLENSNIDIRLAVSAMIETVTQHQLNFETMQRNFEAVIAEIQIIKAEIRELQTENRRILDRVFGSEP